MAVAAHTWATVVRRSGRSPLKVSTEGAISVLQPVRHLIEGEVECRKWVFAAEQQYGVRVMVVVWIFDGQRAAGIEQPEAQCSGLLALTSSATLPPWPLDPASAPLAIR